jgi:membrane protein YqaA with SNARE-associated domain
MLIKILTVVGLATFEVYAAIPAGFAFKLSPFLIFISSTIGGLIGVLMTAYLGKQIKHFLNIYRKVREVKKAPDGLVLKIWNKYGLIGLGFLGTMTVGAPISIGVGVGFNVPINKLVIWCCVGVITRCALFTYLGYFCMQLL